MKQGILEIHVCLDNEYEAMSKICELEKQLAGRQEEIEKLKGAGRGVYALPGVHYAGKPGEGLGGLGPGLGPGLPPCPLARAVVHGVEESLGVPGPVPGHAGPGEGRVEVEVIRLAPHGHHGEAREAGH